MMLTSFEKLQLTTKEVDYLRTLSRRVEFLEKKIADPNARSVKSAKFDRLEVESLRWALLFITDIVSPVIDDSEF
jgi:hypothetical protein